MTETYITRTVTSKDGTAITYRQMGDGPALLLLHGAMCSGASHMELAQALADSFTLILPDRRDRGRADASADYDIGLDVEDVEALLQASGAQRVWGLSAGAIIALEATLRLPGIRQLAIYEPPLFDDLAALAAAETELVAALDKGDLPDAMVTAMFATQMAPDFMKLIPRWLLRRMCAGMLRDEGGGAHDYLPVRRLIPALRHDFALSRHASTHVGQYGRVSAPTLLMNGSASSPYLKAAVVRLEQIIPSTRRMELAGGGHSAALNADRSGKPVVVADAMRSFFTTPLGHAAVDGALAHA